MRSFSFFFVCVLLFLLITKKFFSLSHFCVNCTMCALKMHSRLTSCLCLMLNKRRKNTFKCINNKAAHFQVDSSKLLSQSAIDLKTKYFFLFHLTHSLSRAHLHSSSHLVMTMTIVFFFNFIF